MNNDIEKIKNEMKQKRININKFKNKKRSNSFLYKFSMNVLVVIVLTIMTMIILKKYPELKNKVYEEIYENNISFVSINHLYKNIFGNPIPFSEYFESKIKPVFNEKLSFYKNEEYIDGIKLIVDKQYLVPSLESGMVIFIGDKENYPNTVIIQHVNGIDIWYSNVENIAVNLYDYVDKGSLIGSTINDELYLVFKKNGDIIDYHEYI